MMIWALLIVPASLGLFCLLSRSSNLCRYLLVISALSHSAMVAVLACHRELAVPSGWIGLDDAGLLFLCITSLLFSGVAVYTFGYLKAEKEIPIKDMEEHFFFKNSHNAVFVGCMLFFLATMTLVTVSRHLGLMWVAIEATTLSSAPLIYFHRHHRSLEAVWKYILICSVGIALAMLGNFFIVVAGAHIEGSGPLMALDDLLRHAPDLNPAWMKAAFVLCLVGYGTKMGLAPMHNWLPDAHSEAPSSVSALLSGALLNCAFLVLLRVHTVMIAAGLGDTSRMLFVLLGLLSLGFAAVFIVGQKDFKRMLAYSSVEHMGIIALGLGIGGIGITGCLFHAVNHSLIKGMLFMTAGNIMAAHQTKTIADVRGLIHTRPLTAMLWLAGALAIVGMPPFGLFLSELTVLGGILDAGRFFVAGAYLLALGIIFAALTAKVLPMIFSTPTEPCSVLPGENEPCSTLPGENESCSALPGETTRRPSPRREPIWSIAPLALFGVLSFVLGVYMPPWLSGLLDGVVRSLGGQ